MCQICIFIPSFSSIVPTFSIWCNRLYILYYLLVLSICWDFLLFQSRIWKMDHRVENFSLASFPAKHWNGSEHKTLPKRNRFLVEKRKGYDSSDRRPKCMGLHHHEEAGLREMSTPCQHQERTKSLRCVQIALSTIAEEMLREDSRSLDDEDVTVRVASSHRERRMWTEFHVLLWCHNVH